MKNALNKLIIKMTCKLNNFLQEEEGDTNFISIIVILGIVLVLGALFVSFKDQIIETATNMINNGLSGIH